VLLLLATSPESCFLADTTRSPDSPWLLVRVPWRLVLVTVGVLLVLATSPEACPLADTSSCRLVVSVARCLVLVASREVGVLDLLVLATSVESKCLL